MVRNRNLPTLRNVTGLIICFFLGEFLRDKMYKAIPGLVKPTEEQKAASLSLFEQIAGGALRSS